MGRRHIDITGQTFGRLTALEVVGRNSSGPIWKCKCNCGGFKELNIGNLKRSDYVPSCGSCWSNLPDDLSSLSFDELPMMSSAKDYTNEIIDNIKVISPSRREGEQLVWKCECRLCGNEFERTSNSLNQSSKIENVTANCGCKYYKDRSEEALHKEIYRRYKKGHSQRRRRQGKPVHDFELSFEEFVELSNRPCRYCGLESDNYNVRGHVVKCNGIDRVDSNRGYTKDNIVPCCKICNKSKNDLPLSEWEDWLKRITKYRNNA